MELGGPGVVSSTEFGLAPGGPNPCASLTPTIQEGGSCTLVTSFAPSSLGGRNASLLIESNAVNTPALELNLAGTGVQPKHSLTVNVTGEGSINNLNNPPDFTCTGPSCTGSFEQGTQLTLRGTPASLYRFDGWSGGGCSGTGDCTFTLDNDITVNATFSAFPIARIDGNPTYYFTFGDAYTNASTGSIVRLRNVSFTDDLNLDRPVDITLKGGYESDFASQNGYTSLQGVLTVMGAGSVILHNMIIY
jgi:hypothetical protein